MIILGINGGHNASWCVLQDGVLLGAFEKERFTRKRHDSGEVVSFIDKSLKFLGIDWSKIDLVATSEPVHRNTDPGLRRLAGRKYRRPNEWEYHVVECLGRVLPCVSLPHHLAHAAYARYTSNFDSTAVITWDGGGDFYTEDAYSSTTVSSWKGSKLEWLERIDNSDFGSLWFIYSRAIFGDGNAAGKLMGLAALGSNCLVDEMMDRYLVPMRGLLEGTWSIKNSWPEEEKPAFVSGTCNWQSPTAQNIAFAVQYLTTQAGLAIARDVRQTTGHSNLALSGGVALNGYLNTAIQKSAGFEQVFVPPAVHDGGISVGCALFASNHILGITPPKKAFNSLAFIGMAYSEDGVTNALEKVGLSGQRVDIGEGEAKVAEAIACGKIVAWYEGRSEHGPRALGHRSILCSATDVSMRTRLNDQIKFREAFRPVAPVVLEESAVDYFEIDWTSPYMMYIVNATARGRRDAPAAIHADGTARVQTVKTDCSLGRIVEQVGRLTGVPIVVNTSLNVKSPIVETPRDAIEVFMKVPIDLLYIEGVLVERL